MRRYKTIPLTRLILKCEILSRLQATRLQNRINLISQATRLLGFEPFRAATVRERSQDYNPVHMNMICTRSESCERLFTRAALKGLETIQSSLVACNREHIH